MSRYSFFDSPQELERPLNSHAPKIRDVNKDLTPKDQDKDKDLTPKDQDKDKDLTPKDKDKDLLNLTPQGQGPDPQGPGQGQGLEICP